MQRPADNTQKLSNYIVSDQGQQKIQRFSPAEVEDDELKRTALHLVRNGPDKLAECTPESLVDGVLQSYHLGLDPTMGESYLIPYYNKDVGSYEAEHRVSYKGLVKLAKKRSEVRHLFAGLVREGETFEFRRTLDGVEFEHEPDPFDGGDIKGSYCVIKYENGEADVEIMGMDDLKKVRAKSGNPHESEQ